MKKLLLTFLLICFTMGIGLDAQAGNAYNSQIRRAISKYKTGNYVGCMQDLQWVTKVDPSNAVAHYYLASSYMKLGNSKNATTEFNKVVSINSSSALTSYAIQARNCLNAKGGCTYMKLGKTDVAGLRKDPENYIKNMQAQKAKAAQDRAAAIAKARATSSAVPASADDVEIRKLISGKYHSNIHPDANRVIIDTLLKQEKHDMNANSGVKLKSEAVVNEKIASADTSMNSSTSDAKGPSNDEIANAVKTLAKAGINPLQQYNQAAMYQMPNAANNEYAAMGMMFGNGNNNNQGYNNNMMNMLPYILQQSPQGSNNPQANASLIQSMMMSQMMPDLGGGSDSKY